MEGYRRVIYIEKIGNSNPDEPSSKSFAACLNISGITNMEYYFAEDISNEMHRDILIKRGVKESILLNLIKRNKLRGSVGCVIVEANKKTEMDLDKRLKRYRIEKIVLS